MEDWLPSTIQIKQLQETVFAFYQEHGRSFPWRNTNDRYAVMVSEIMLQQTQADRVVKRFTAWLEAFPTVQALAEAPLREVLALWSGLGYNSRAERLQRCAQIIVADFGGIVPSQPEILIQLPGIGAYTSRSIPIFADNLDVATVDTNIRRIMLHEFGLPETLKPRELQMVADMLLPKGQSRKWHNALMDYGALHLTSQKSGIRPLTRQSKFQGSRRWYRGQMLKALLQAEALPLEVLEATWSNAPYCLRDIANDLVREGLVEYQPSSSADDSPLLRIRGNR